MGCFRWKVLHLTPRHPCPVCEGSSFGTRIEHGKKIGKETTRYDGCICIYIYMWWFIPNSFICKRPFFANREMIFANLSCLSFAGVSRQNLSLRKKNFRGVSCWNPRGLCNRQSLHGPLLQISHICCTKSSPVQNG